MCSSDLFAQASSLSYRIEIDTTGSGNAFIKVREITINSGDITRSRQINTPLLLTSGTLVRIIVQPSLVIVTPTISGTSSTSNVPNTWFSLALISPT